MHRSVLEIALVSVMVAGVGSMGWSETSSADGAKVFAAKCATCHAKDGKGNPTMGKVLKVEQSKLDMTSKDTQSKTDAELTKIITDGQGKMPAFKGKVKDADIQATVAYLRTLAPKTK